MSLEDIRSILLANADKPVIVIIRISNPTIVSEFENEIDGLIINFGIQDQALMDIISGAVEPLCCVRMALYRLGQWK